MRSLQLLTLALVAIAAKADSATYAYEGRPGMFADVGACPDPCQITGFFIVTDAVSQNIGPQLLNIVADVIDFGFGLNGKNDLLTPANSSMFVQVNTIDELPGTGTLWTCFPFFCSWHIGVGGIGVGEIITTGSLIGGINNGGYEEIDIPGLFAEDMDRPGLWVVPPPIVAAVPEPAGLVLLITVALLFGLRVRLLSGERHLERPEVEVELFSGGCVLVSESHIQKQICGRDARRSAQVVVG